MKHSTYNCFKIIITVIYMFAFVCLFLLFFFFFFLLLYFFVLFCVH